VWAAEGSLIKTGLSVLLSGRLVARSGNSLLHKIQKNHLVQSIEWSAEQAHQTQFGYYQVSLEVEEAPATILHLSTHTLNSIMDHRPDLKLVMECIVAKDVSMKLYMMNKMVGDTSSDAAFNKQTKNKNTDSCKKSSSMDAINTGWRGLMRSYFWSEQGHDDKSLFVGGFNRGLDMPTHVTSEAD